MRCKRKQTHLDLIGLVTVKNKYLTTNKINVQCVQIRQVKLSFLSKNIADKAAKQLEMNTCTKSIIIKYCIMPIQGDSQFIYKKNGIDAS